MKLKSYPKYKDSSIQWIGKIPEGWEVRKIKQICSKSAEYGLNEPSDNYVEEGVRFLRITDITENERLIKNGVYLPENKTNKEYLLDTGDVLVARSGSIGTSLYFDKRKYGECLFAGYLVRFVVNKSNSGRFLYYFTNSGSFYAQIELATIQTTIGNFNGQKYANMRITIPSLPEQTAIANFLDKRTTEIDALIEKDKKLIALLKEKRIALINHAVTKGLNSNAKLKDSGIEWIGEIPEGWEVKKLKFVSEKITTGKTPPSENYGYYDNGEINWFTPGDMGDEFILKKSTRKITSLALLENKTTKYQPKTVLLVGIGATLGKVGMITDIGTSNQQINAIQFDELEINPKYGLYYLYGYKNAIISLSNTSTIGIFNQTQTANFFIIISPKEEQQKIVDHLDKATAKIDKIIKHIENKIKLLEEYKKSLIHHAVTGKIDVKEAVA